MKFGFKGKIETIQDQIKKLKERSHHKEKENNDLNGSLSKLNI